MLNKSKGITVEVRTPQTGELDEMGEPITDSYTSVFVSGVLWSPGTTTDSTSGKKINTVDIQPAFYFPKTFTDDLRGTSIVYNEKLYRVIGSPQAYMNNLTPGDWNRVAYVKEVE